MQALVVGAGISGLATAWYLQREAARRERDLDITVLEADDRVGGVRSVIPTLSDYLLPFHSPEQYCKPCYRRYTAYRHDKKR